MVPAKKSDLADSGPIHRLTENPLATLNISKKDYRSSKLSLSSSRRRKQEEIYSVTRYVCLITLCVSSLINWLIQPDNHV